MRCANCEMVYKSLSSSGCPLCGTSSNIKKVNGFLQRKIAKIGKHEVTFSQIYCLIAVNIIIILGVINLIINLGFLWFLPVATAVFTSYFVLALISNGRNSLLKLYRRWLIVILPTVVLMQFFTFSGNWAVQYVTPAVLLLGCLFVLIALLFLKTKTLKCFFTAFVIQIISIVPFVLHFANVIYTSAVGEILIILAFSFASLAVINLGMYMAYLFKNKINAYKSEKKL